MATHVVLMKGMRDPEVIKLLPERLHNDCTANGGKLLSLLWTDGPYEAVAVIELDSVSIPTFVLYLQSSLARQVVVMRALNQDEAAEALRRWVPGPGSGHLGPKESAPE